MEFQTMVGKLMAEGHEPALIATAALRLCFQRADEGLVDIEFDRKSDDGRLYRKLFLTIGRRQKVAPNHIVSAIAGRANVRGAEIGKIEIYDERTVVGVPAERAEAIERAMQGAAICGIPVRARLSTEKPAAKPAPGARNDRRENNGRPRRDRADAPRYGAKPYGRSENADASSRRGKVKLSPAAKARLLDTADLGRFEIGSEKRAEKPRRSRPDDRRDSRGNSRRSNARNERGRGRR